MPKLGVIVAVIGLGFGFQGLAKPKWIQEPKAKTKKKLAAFPKDKAKWMIHGKVKADAILAQRVRGPRITKPGVTPKNVTLELVAQQNPRNQMLPGAVVTVLDLERRWRFPSRAKTHRITINKQLRFVPRTVILDVDDSMICDNLSGAHHYLSLRFHGSGGSSSTYSIHSEKKLLIEDTSNGGGKLQTRMTREGIHGVWNTRNASRGTLLMLASTSCRDSQAWVYLSAHPICAITDEYGRFTLPKLPDGEYKLLVTHELLGKITKTVKIEGRPRGWVTFEFKVPKGLRAKPTQQQEQKKGK